MNRWLPGMTWFAILGASVALLLGVTPVIRAQTGSESSVGYIDDAIPTTQVRFRSDFAYGVNEPDRAEFFWPGPSGPPLGERKVDFQELSAYLEWAATSSFSAFLEVPVRFVNPEVNANAGGLSDIIAGFKWALVAEEKRYFTFELKAFTPSGDGNLGLGTNHFSLEPALLFNQRLTDRILLEAEFHDWIPIATPSFAGQVLRYGVGLSYDTHPCTKVRVSPVAEFVGWTVLSGEESLPIVDIPVNAAGDTIVNAKLGVRTVFGDNREFYVGYGRALTGDVWYKDILRLEYRRTF
jgi:hypothetical protein